MEHRPKAALLPVPVPEREQPIYKRTRPTESIPRARSSHFFWRCCVGDTSQTARWPAIFRGESGGSQLGGRRSPARCLFDCCRRKRAVTINHSRNIAGFPALTMTAGHRMACGRLLTGDGNSVIYNFPYHGDVDTGPRPDPDNTGRVRSNDMTSNCQLTTPLATTVARVRLCTCSTLKLWHTVVCIYIYTATRIKCNCQATCQTRLRGNHVSAFHSAFLPFLLSFFPFLPFPLPFLPFLCTPIRCHACQHSTTLRIHLHHSSCQKKKEMCVLMSEKKH